MGQVGESDGSGSDENDTMMYVAYVLVTVMTMWAISCVLCRFSCDDDNVRDILYIAGLLAVMVTI